MLVLVTFHLSLITSLAQVDSLYHVFERQMGPLRVETGNELMQALLSEGFGDDLTFSPQTHPDTLTMTASYYAAEYFLNVRQLDRCLDAALTALPLTKGNDDYTWQSETLNLLTLAYFYLSNYGEALRYGEMGYAIDSQQQDYERMSSTLNTLAGIYLAARQPQQARQYTDKAIDADRRTADHLHAPAIYGCASEVYQELGLYDQALDYARQALDYEQRQGGHPSKMAIRQAQMATACSAVGDTARARQLLLECIPVLAEGGVMPSLGISLNTLGEVMRKEGRTDAAARYFEQARQLFLQTGDLYNQARSLHGLFAALYDSDPKTAMLHLDDYTKLKDSIYQDDMKQMLSNYSTRFHVSQLTEQNAEAQRTNRIIIIGAIVIVLLLILVLAFVVYAMRTKSKANQQLLDLQHTREDFFTNITHEFRTPLTVILGMGHQLEDQEHEDMAQVRSAAKMIVRQGNSLLGLINQLLDISKVRSAVGEPKWQHGNIVAFVEMTIEYFRPYAESKRQELTFSHSLTSLDMDFVPDYMERIISNLVTNSIKYTPSYGKVNVTLEQSGTGRMKLQVFDTGRGIKAEVLPHIFDAFFQGETQDGDVGSGVGLSLVRLMVEGMNGTISAESIEGQGSTFTVMLPMKTAHPLSKGGELLAPSHESSANNTVVSKNSQIPSLGEGQGVGSWMGLTILIVEDNQDIAHYIGLHLKDCRLLYARGGEEGLLKAQETMPDLIITDIMMPGEVDGLELCRQVRASELLCHIPIIVITAKTTEADRIRGLEAGADAYLVKPFNSEELLVRVRKLLERQEKLRNKYQQIGMDEQESTPATELKPQDRQFMNHLVDVVYRLMASGNVDMDSVASEMAVSRTQLNRKILAITGQNSSAYIMQLRLARAKRLLKADENTPIGNVALRCGFDDVAYFSRIFKQTFQMTPSQYRKQNI